MCKVYEKISSHSQNWKGLFRSLRFRESQVMFIKQSYFLKVYSDIQVAPQQSKYLIKDCGRKFKFAAEFYESQNVFHKYT